LTSSPGKDFGSGMGSNSLFLRYLHLIAAIRTRYAVIEKVHGVTSKKLGALPVILVSMGMATDGRASASNLWRRSSRHRQH
jgi:site-specific DNA-cytosine methylase